MTNKTIHSGHRQRLRETIKKVGFANLNDYQKMEYILTLASPRKDMNDVAHILIDEFGSVGAVLHTDPELLSKVSGIGQATAEILSTIPEIAKFYAKDMNCKQKTQNNYQGIHNYLSEIFFDNKQEMIVLLILNKDYTIRTHRVVGKGDFSSVKLDMTKINNFLYIYETNIIALAHNHPYGDSRPSVLDIEANEKIRVYLENFHINYFDSFIWTENSLYSFRIDNVIHFEDVSFE